MQIISFIVSSNKPFWHIQSRTFNIEGNAKQTTAFEIYVYEILLKNLTLTDEVTLEL